MKMIQLAVLALLSLGPTAMPGAAQEPGHPVPQREPGHPFPQHVDYGKGVIIPDHVSRRQLDDDVREFYEYWKAEYLVDVGTDTTGNRSYRVAFGRRGTSAHAVTVSEGQGYGMLIVAIMAGHETQAREIFDGLWRFARQHPSNLDARLMAWRVPEPAAGNDSAFDGDADVAYALLLASEQWPSSGGVDYEQEARTLIAAIYESTIGPRSKLPLLGDWVQPDGNRYNEYTNRPSDFVLASFRAFFEYTGRPRWKRVLQRSRRAIRKLQVGFGAGTGLLPDFTQPVSRDKHDPVPADPEFLEGPYDGRYYFNACRTPLRIGMDAVLNGKSRNLVRGISNWAEAHHGGQPSKLGAGYELQGARLANSAFFSTAFAAPLGVAAMTRPDQQEWLNDVYRAIHDERQGYYEDSLNLLSLLLMTGNFWDSSTF